MRWTFVSPSPADGHRGQRYPPLLAIVVTLFCVLPSPLALADTAVVPTDFLTIQEAVDAVQGTTDALVRIDDNGTFVETVVATQSVAIEAGNGFSPTIEAAAATCSGFSGGCAVSFNPDSDVTPMSFALRGIRLVPPAGANSSDRLFQVFNEGDVDARRRAAERGVQATAGAENVLAASRTLAINLLFMIFPPFQKLPEHPLAGNVPRAILRHQDSMQRACLGRSSRNASTRVTSLPASGNRRRHTFQRLPFVADRSGGPS